MNAESAKAVLQSRTLLSTQFLRSVSAGGEFQAPGACDSQSAKVLAPAETNTRGLITKGSHIRAEGISGSGASKHVSVTNRDYRQRLWSYAFPHAAPVRPEHDELGLPAWWLNTLRVSSPKPPPPSDATAFLQSIRKKMPEQSRIHMRRRSRGMTQQ